MKELTPDELLRLYDSVGSHLIEIIESASANGFDGETESRLMSALAVINEMVGLSPAFDINNSSHRQSILDSYPGMVDLTGTTTGHH